MIVALASLAFADPAALRSPHLGRGVVVALSTRQASVAGWLRPDIGVAFAATRASVAALIAGRRHLAGDADRWRLVGGLGCGPSWLVIDNRVGVATSSHLSLERDWTHGFFQVDIAAPVAVAFGGPVEVAVPLRLEIGGGWVGRRGPVSAIGGKLGVGTTLYGDLPASIDGQLTLLVQLGR